MPTPLDVLHRDKKLQEVERQTNLSCMFFNEAPTYFHGRKNFFLQAAAIFGCVKQPACTKTPFYTIFLMSF
jgi:hypothetical protein